MVLDITSAIPTVSIPIINIMKKVQPKLFFNLCGFFRYKDDTGH